MDGKIDISIKKFTSFGGLPLAKLRNIQFQKFFFDAAGDYARWNQHTSNGPSEISKNILDLNLPKLCSRGINSSQCLSKNNTFLCYAPGMFFIYISMTFFTIVHSYFSLCPQHRRTRVDSYLRTFHTVVLHYSHRSLTVSRFAANLQLWGPLSSS